MSEKVLGSYGQPTPQQETQKPKSLIVNPRSFIGGGINKGIPPYLIKDEQWLDSYNMVYDFEKAFALAPRKTVDTLVATPSTIPPAVPPPPVVRTDTVSGGSNLSFNYQILATNSPTSYGGFSTLPGDLSFDPTTGIFSGTLPSAIGTYIIPITATNGTGTGAGTLTIIVLPYVIIAPENTLPSGLIFTFEIAIDGGLYQTGVFAKPYLFSIAVSYKITIPTCVYTSASAVWIIEAFFTGIGAVTKAGSTVSLTYAATPPLTGSITATNCVDFVGNFSVAPGSQTTDVIGLNVNAISRSNIIAELNSNIPGTTTVTNAVFETILKF